MASLDFENAKDKGIHAPFARDFMAFDSVNGRDVINFRRTAQKMAMDAAITAPNVGLPAALYQYLSPEIIPVLFSPNNATKLATETKYGDFTTEFMQFPVEEVVGSVQPYSDYNSDVSTDVNYNFPVRENFRFQTAIKFGDLETEKAAVAKIQLAARKQKAAALVLAKASNLFYLFGVQGKQNYGLLNDPNLNPAISPITTNSKTTWKDKTEADPGQSANIVFADINKLVTALSTSAGGHFDANAPMVLGISNAMAPYLDRANTYGVTARQLINQTYPGMQIVQIPELSTVAGEELYLTMGEVDGIAVSEAAYSEKYRLGRLVPFPTFFEQKASASTFGGVVKLPAFIATMTGIA